MSLLRARRRKYSMASRRMAVRTHVAWYWRGLFISLALGAGVALAWLIYGVGGQAPGQGRGVSEPSLEQLMARISQLEMENENLRSARVKIDRHTQIDAEVLRNLEGDLKALQDENATLKEELAFVRGIAASQSGALIVQRFTVKNDVPGFYRFHLLLVQAGRKENMFRGRLQLVVTASGSGGRSTQTFPANAASDENYTISLKSYQNIEGRFQLPPGQVAKSVEARIYGEGSTQPEISKKLDLS